MATRKPKRKPSTRPRPRRRPAPMAALQAALKTQWRADRAKPYRALFAEANNALAALPTLPLPPWSVSVEEQVRLAAAWHTGWSDALARLSLIAARLASDPKRAAPTRAAATALDTLVNEAYGQIADEAWAAARYTMLQLETALRNLLAHPPGRPPDDPSEPSRLAEVLTRHLTDRLEHPTATTRGRDFLRHLHQLAWDTKRHVAEDGVRADDDVIDAVTDTHVAWWPTPGSDTPRIASRKTIRNLIGQIRRSLHAEAVHSSVAFLPAVAPTPDTIPPGEALFRANRRAVSRHEERTHGTTPGDPTPAPDGARGGHTRRPARARVVSARAGRRLGRERLGAHRDRAGRRHLARRS